MRDNVTDIYMKVLDQVNNEAMSFLNESISQYDIPPSFISFMVTRIYFDKISNMFWLVKRENDDTIKVSKHLQNDIRNTVINASAEFQDPDFLAEEYQEWLNYYLKSMIYKEIMDSLTSFNEIIFDSIYFKRLESILSPIEVQLLVYNDGIRFAKAYDLVSFDKLQPRIERYITDTTWKNALNTKYDEMVNELNQPLPANAFLFDLDDEELLDIAFDDILSKYKGNVIYLDFWASWCGPCKMEMPHSEALSQKLIDEDVTFLYVSIDRDVKAWENMIKVMQLRGIHYRLGMNTINSVSEEYGVQSIPHYVLFDRKGNLVKNKMTRPGNPETEKEIRKLLFL